MMPPRNSDAVNCQPIKTTRITPSSITRLVEASSKTIAAVKLPPLRKIERASASAAYEQELDATPKSVASVRLRGESSPMNFAIVLCETRAWITPESAKPRTSGQNTSQNISKAVTSAWLRALMTIIVLAVPQRRARTSLEDSVQAQCRKTPYTQNCRSSTWCRRERS